MNHGLTIKAVKINRQTFKYLKQPNRAFNASLELFLFLDFMRHGLIDILLQLSLIFSDIMCLGEKDV